MFEKGYIALAIFLRAPRIALNRLRLSSKSTDEGFDVPSDAFCVAILNVFSDLPQTHFIEMPFSESGVECEPGL